MKSLLAKLKKKKKALLFDSWVTFTSPCPVGEKKRMEGREREEESQLHSFSNRQLLIFPKIK